MARGRADGPRSSLSDTSSAIGLSSFESGRSRLSPTALMESRPPNPLGCAMSAPPDHDAACPFCRNLAGNPRSAFVNQSDTVSAFVNPRQYRPGALLVIPNRHVVTVFRHDGRRVSAVAVHAQRLARADAPTRHWCNSTNSASSSHFGVWLRCQAHCPSVSDSIRVKSTRRPVLLSGLKAKMRIAATRRTRLTRTGGGAFTVFHRCLAQGTVGR